MACQSNSDGLVGQLPDKIDFNLHIKPILSDRCFACHGPDENALKGNLRLDIEEQAFALLDSSDNRYAIIPGDTKNSALIQRILSKDPEFIMPPPESNLHLSDYEIKLLEKWIAQGAEWKKHWAFIPPKQATFPNEVQEHPIDFFIQKKLKEKGLSAAPKANKEALLRRLSFDLTGLPPSKEDLDRFLANNSPTAYEEEVDRYLNSIHYGERMASIWLDVARYADSHGYQDDRPRTMWPWRDWVIEAFNQNLPYNDFVSWQIAGDLLPNPSYKQKLATGFNRNHAITQEGGVVQEEYLTEYAADRAQTFSTAFLGLTMECARCHSHKYDPILQEEYYSLFGFFNNIEERGQISYFDLAPSPNLKAELPLMDSTIADVKAMIERLEQQQTDRSRQVEAEAQQWSDAKLNKEEIVQSLGEGLLAHFNFTSNTPLQNNIQPNPDALSNVNLPPGIDQPQWIEAANRKGLAFNGSNFLTIGELGDFDRQDQFSFGGWIKHSGKHKKNAAIFGRRNGEQFQQGYDVVLQADNRLSFRIIGSWRDSEKPPKENDYAIAIRTKARIPTNTWTHIFATYDGSNKAKGLRLFINGKEQASTILIDQLRTATILNGNDFLIGNWNHRARQRGDLYGFEAGAVTEFWLYERALSSLEIKLLFDQTVFSPSKKELAEYHLKNNDATFQSLQNRLDSLRSIDLEIPTVMIMQEMDTIKATYLLERGQYDAKVRQVNRGTPKAVLEFTEKYPNNRLGLAQWLFDDQNPLTSRVFVNRIWQLFFEKGIVKTPEDFGNQGALPSHPELLDWLAVEFRKMDWDIKALIKLIVTSEAYQQSAKINPKSLQKDPENIWLSRGPNRRLSAEMLRDQVLAASGLLNKKVGGKWVKPYQPPGIWKALANQIGENKYRSSRGQDLYRRSLYTYWKRTIPPPSMLTFDASERAVCTVKRQETSTPLQSLVLLNDPQFVEAARKLAESVLLNQNSAVEAAISDAFQIITSRTPEGKELQILVEMYEQELKGFNSVPENSIALLNAGEAPLNPNIDQKQLASMTIVTNAIFNLDEAKFK